MMAATGTSLTNPELPQFNGNNYDYGAITMRALFSSQDIWELVENGFPEPVDAAALVVLIATKRDLLRDNKKEDSKALFYLYQVVHVRIFPRIVVKTKSKEAWDILKSAYQGVSVSLCSLPPVIKHALTE